jgi:hypothetical protein
MNRNTYLVILALLSILLIASPGLAQEAEHSDHGESQKPEAHEEEHAEETEHQEHGGGHGGRPHHKNDIGIFVGVTDEHGHASEPTLGVDYRRLVAQRWAVGALFDYAGGDLRNAIFAASVTWFPVGRLQLTAAPGVEFHRGRGPTVDCGCGGALKSEDPEQTGLFDEDARYFLFRLGAGWHFPIGQIYGISPNVNVDFVNGEKVWVYGVNFTFAW